MIVRLSAAIIIIEVAIGVCLVAAAWIYWRYVR